MRPPINKAKLHTDTCTRSYTDTDSALNTSKRTKLPKQNLRRSRNLPTPDIESYGPVYTPEGQSVPRWKDQEGRVAPAVKSRLTLYTKIRGKCTKLIALKETQVLAKVPK